MIWTFSLGDIDRVAKEILGFLERGPSKVVALNGQMGAGKTTLVSAFVRALGCIDTPGSPTFSIINQYADANGNPIYHMDWYRLKDEEEAIQAGVEDPLFEGAWCFVEWPEKALGLLPEDYRKAIIETLGPDRRRLTIEP